MFKFLHAADVHLDSPLRGLERYDGAPIERIRQASRRALENLIELAIEEKVDFVLLAGDLYDGDWKDYNTGLFLIHQMSRLREAEIPVFLIAGNHDAANRMSRMLRLPDNVTRFSDDVAESHALDDIGVVIHGRSFPTQAVLEDLSQSYPQRRRGQFNIGLLHTCAAGSEGHERYAPCTVEGLRGLGYQYWALGHVHQRQVLHQDPPIVFPGNVQGRHIRESGAKGCLLVTARDDRAEIDFRSLDVMRWERCRVDASDLDTPDAILEAMVDRLVQLRQQSDGRLLGVRVELFGASPAHEALLADVPRWSNEVRARALEIGGEHVWIEKVCFQTRSARGQPAALADGPLEELVGVLAELRGDAGELAEALSELAKKLPAETGQGADALDLDDPDWLRAALDQAGAVLMHRLLTKEAGR